MNLIGWQSRLERHFEDLRRQRSATVGERPIFALEHGLERLEVAELQEQIRAHVAVSPPSREHSLAWTVYAAEIGYRYAGDEYWQTFESETPGWLARGKRSWIREQFIAFHEDFGGAKPSGPWADWFSIICWPITHAILPKDLQRQLARVLYEVRHLFAGDLLENPARLGEMIAARSWNASSRFQNLAQEPLLVGQIAAALLVQKEGATKRLILPSTLQRIGEDLERERQARQWLLGARKLAHQATLRGLSSTPAVVARAGSAVEQVERARQELELLGVEPRLILMPAIGGSWEVFLETPDLSPLLGRFPSLRTVLTQSRCVVAGSSGRPLWQGSLLRGTRRIRFEEWPQAAEPLLRFERSVPELDYLLRTECLLRPGPRWLFRVASDGLAYELRGMLARPGHRYVLLSASAMLEDSGRAVELKIGCKGVRGVAIDLPQVLSEEWLSCLRKLGVDEARRLEVWPAGLAAAFWDGEGRAEWLTSDEPCVAIRADHPLHGLVITLDGDVAGRVSLPAISKGEITFLGLPGLAPGSHSLRAQVVSNGGARDEQSGYLQIAIREPRLWTPGVTSQGALIVRLDPSTPSLEQLWEGRLSIEVHGPAGREITCTASLFDRHGSTPRVRKRLPQFALPVRTPTWQTQFEKFFRRTQEVQSAYDSANSCAIELSAEELGAFSFICEREFTPLRWSVQRSGNRYSVTLFDDRGVDTAPSVECYQFQTPDVPTMLDPFARQYAAPEGGGLYVATAAECRRAIIVPPAGRALHSLSELGSNPQVTYSDRSTEGIIRLFEIASTWHSARLSGDLLAATRKRSALVALIQHAFTMIGGENWEQAERRTLGRNDAEALEILKRAVSSRPDERGFGATLMLEREKLALATPRERALRIAELGRAFLRLTSTALSPPGAVSVGEKVQSSNSAWLCELALRLASCSDGTEKWAGGKLREGISRLRDVPALARAARCLVLFVEKSLEPGPIAGGPVYVGWEWE